MFVKNKQHTPIKESTKLYKSNENDIWNFIFQILGVTEIKYFWAGEVWGKCA